MFDPAAKRSSLPVRLSGSPIVTLVAVGLAASIFLVDTLTPFGMAVAVLYVLVILVAGGCFQRRGILATAAACIGLTVVSYVLAHGDTAKFDSLARGAMSVAAIVVTTMLVIRNQSAARMSQAQAMLLDLSHDTIFVRDMTDVITYWNKGAEEMYGWTADEAIGRVSYDLLETKFPAPIADIRAMLLRAGRWDGELVRTTRTGRTLTVTSRWSLKTDERGRPVAILETNNDITERKIAEARVLRGEQELRLAIDTIPLLVSQAGPDGYVEYFNRRWHDYTGMSTEEARGWGWRAVVHPDDIGPAFEARNAIFAAGMAGEMEARLRSRDGSYRWFLIRTEPLRDEHGAIQRWYIACIDIQDRKSAEKALQRSEAYLAEAQRLSSTGSFGWNTKSNRISWSEETFRIFGYPTSVEPTIERIIARVHPDDVALVRREIERATRHECGMDFAHRLLLPDGSVRYVRVLAHHTTEGSCGTACIGAVTDVTAAKTAEGALQKAQADLAHATRVATLGEMAASIVHEVNQPLAAIVTTGDACLRFLSRDPPDLEEVRGAVDAMIRDGLRAGEVIRRLRAHARKADLQMNPLDLNDVVADVRLMVDRELTSHLVTLQLACADDIPRVRGDRIQLQQVLLNLVMNAIDAMAEVSPGRRDITVASRRDGDAVVVAVKDAGAGFDPAQAGRMFETFWSTKSNGMGMGLPISRSIVEAHGGRLWAEPNPDVGATFQFSLPLPAPPATSARA